jgi:phosphoribosylanthranilate isomerase
MTGIKICGITRLEDARFAPIGSRCPGFFFYRPVPGT